MERKKIKIRKKVDAEDSWREYFASIQQVCPWSLPAYEKGKIKITQWQNTPEELSGYLAIVYVYFTRPQRLRKIHNTLNDTTESEWLWSHPEMGGHSSPVPCLIQQDPEQLRKIRDAIRTKQSND